MTKAKVSQLFMVNARKSQCPECNGDTNPGNVTMRINRKWAEVSMNYCQKCDMVFVVADSAWFQNGIINIGDVNDSPYYLDGYKKALEKNGYKVTKK